jgi:septum formation protein
LKFDVVPSTFSEDLDKSTFSHPSEYVNETAYRKALEVADKVRSQGKFDLLISADTIVVRKRVTL